MNHRWICATAILLCVVGCGDDAAEEEPSFGNNGSNGDSGPTLAQRFEIALDSYEREGRVGCDTDFECFPDWEEDYSVGECYSDIASVNKLRSEELVTELVLCAESAAAFQGCYASTSCDAREAFFVGLEDGDLDGLVCEEEWVTFMRLCESYRTDPEQLPSEVRISISGAAVNVSKTSGEPWDGSGALGSEVVALGASLAGLPYPEVAAELTDAAIDHLAKPDTFGTVEIDSGGGFGMSMDLAPAVEDNFLPTWDPADYTGVPFAEDTRVRIALLDEDLANHDPIGTVEVGFDDLVEAWYAGEVHHVFVGDQSNDQLLFVSISVRGN